MTIAIDMNDDAAVFRYPPAYAETVDEFDTLLDGRANGGLTGNRYIRALEELVARHPWFIDGHAHIGNALYDRGEFGRALEAYERGYSRGTAPLPDGFEKLIEWRHLENRPFLRAAHGVALSQLRLGRRGEGIATMEKMLAWNPADHQGVRLVIGSEYLRAGRDDRARSFFQAEAGYPSYRYEMALLLLRQEQHIEAATSLRRGFVENAYIAEILCGNPHPLPIGMWHGTSWADPGLAIEYVSDYGKLWHATPDAVAFLRWLHTHPRVMAERAGVLRWQEALLWEHDAGRRATLIDGAEAAWQEIDDRLSREIVTERTDRRGRGVLPWLHSGGLPPGRGTG